jgi:prepilin-type processing-associated H-X9-DG protein
MLTLSDLDGFGNQSNVLFFDGKFPGRRRAPLYWMGCMLADVEVVGIFIYFHPGRFRKSVMSNVPMFSCRLLILLVQM